jgi:diaminopropionate ammonia-lyase
VGSLAHAAVLWYNPSNTEIITVEPTTAACLRASLLAGRITPIETGHTIMPGLNCGTVSHQAWPDLRGKVKLEDALVVADQEVERAVEDLEGWGVMAGPCGAASLAGLRQLQPRLTELDVVVLICTEGRGGQ